MGTINRFRALVSRPAFIPVLLVVATVVAFWPAFFCDFVRYDDGDYFFSNPHVQTGLSASGVAWAFTTGHASNWHPLTWLSLMFDAGFFGTGPAGPHATNVVLHAANVVLSFVLLRRLTGAVWRSALVAALFALHPLHVESVAWISERKDVLSTCFGFLSLLCYAGYVKRKQPEQNPGNPSQKKMLFSGYWLALGFFALGLLSKPMLVTLPFVMLLLDFWPLRRFERRAAAARRSSILFPLVEKLPFVALSIASCVVTYLVQSRSGAVHSLANIPMNARIENAVVSYARYLYKMFWPVNLAIPYPHPGFWPAEKLVFSIALLFVAGAVVLGFARRAPYVVTGWFWYVGMLIPVIGLVQTGIQSMADRYTYMPLIGIFIIGAWGAGALLERCRFRSITRPATVTAAALGIIGCGALTMRQVGFWRNTETLFRHATEVTRNNDIAYYNLGCYYQEKNRIDEAIANYRTALEIRACYDDALNNLGIALAMQGEMDEGVRWIREAIRCQPEKADSYYNLGNVLVMQRKFDDAAGSFREALRLDPGFAPAHYNFANILVMQGHPVEAAAHYRETLRLNPRHEGARRQLQALGVPMP